MKYLEAYNELLTLIDVYETLYYSYKTAFYSASKLISGPAKISSIDYSNSIKSNKVQEDTQITLSRLFKYKNNMNLAKETLEELKKDKERIETYIASLEGTEYKVAYLSAIKNKDCEFISKSLGISEGRVKNILTNIKKHCKN